MEMLVTVLGLLFLFVISATVVFGFGFILHAILKGKP